MALTTATRSFTAALLAGIRDLADYTLADENESDYNLSGVTQGDETGGAGQGDRARGGGGGGGGGAAAAKRTQHPLSKRSNHI